MDPNYTILEDECKRNAENYVRHTIPMNINTFKSAGAMFVNYVTIKITNAFVMTKRIYTKYTVSICRKCHFIAEIFVYTKTEIFKLL